MYGVIIQMHVVPSPQPLSNALLLDRRDLTKQQHFAEEIAFLSAVELLSKVNIRRDPGERFNLTRNDLSIGVPVDLMHSDCLAASLNHETVKRRR
jgi:hypothetical protein